MNGSDPIFVGTDARFPRHILGPVRAKDAIAAAFRMHLEKSGEACRFEQCERDDPLAEILVYSGAFPWGIPKAMRRQQGDRAARPTGHTGGFSHV